MPRAASDIVDVNREFYEHLWRGVQLRAPRQFNTWPLLSELAAAAPARLEIGPGRLPRLPLEGTEFVDLSAQAVSALRGAGARAQTGEITTLAYDDAAFDLVCAFDIIEHTADDRRALAEIARVLRPGGTLVCSLPLYMTAWTGFDELVGHYRRYEPGELRTLLVTNGFALKRSAAYGMQPRSQLLLRFGLWWLRRHYEHAMRWYNRCFMPLALRWQQPLEFVPGLVSDPRVDEVILVCRRDGA
jgi:SAM-dependent methyltransferase